MSDDAAPRNRKDKMNQVLAALPNGNGKRFIGSTFFTRRARKYREIYRSPKKSCANSEDGYDGRSQPREPPTNRLFGPGMGALSTRPDRSCGVDDLDVESYVMGNLQGAAVREHIEKCKQCEVRVQECTARLSELREALRAYYDVPSNSFAKSIDPHGLELLAHPEGHIVYPYRAEAHFVEAISMYARLGLRQGEAVIFVLTAAHFEPIKANLLRDGFHLEALQASGQLVFENAERLLATFLTHGKIDESQFKSKIGDVLAKATFHAGVILTRPVRIFGEMVNVIWKSDPEATVRLEELWNEVLATYRCPLLCAYSLGGVESGLLPAELLACHTHTISPYRA